MAHRQQRGDAAAAEAVSAAEDSGEISSAADGPLPSPPPPPAGTKAARNLNPFYIEPPHQQRTTWDGDWQEYDDEDDEYGSLEDEIYQEERGLLGTGGENYYADDDGLDAYRRGGGGRLGAADSGANGALGRRGNRGGGGRGGGGGGGGLSVSPRACVVVTVVFLIFFVFVSLGGGGGQGSGQKQPPLPSPTVPSPGAPASSPASAQQPPTATGSGSSSGGGGQGAPSSPQQQPQNEQPGGGSSDANSQPSNPDEGKQQQQQPPQRVVILGERHSGLERLLERVSSCFADISSGDNEDSNNEDAGSFRLRRRIVQSGYVRPGYWFQWMPPFFEALPKNSTLMVYAVRHPIPWVEAMRLKPVFLLDHYNRTTMQRLPWGEFVQRPYTMPRPDRDSVKRPSESCQLKFTYSQVLPCHVVDQSGNIVETSAKDAANSSDNSTATGPGASAAVYELPDRKDGTMTPFENILQLRAAKLRHVMDELPSNTWKHALVQGAGEAASQKQPIVVHYEQQDSAVWNAVQRISEIMGWEITCNPSDFSEQDSAGGGGSTKDDDEQVLRTFSNPDGSEYAAAIRDLVDWDAEAAVGYSPDAPWHRHRT